MKKKLLLSFVLLTTMLFSSRMVAQSDDAFAKGKVIISVGYGYPNFTKSLFKTYDGYAGYSASGMGPLTGKVEYALSDKIGLGVCVNYVQYKVQWNSDIIGGTSTYKAGWKGTSFSALLRMNLHFATSEKLDPYWGIGVGYRANNYTYFNEDPTASSALSLKGAIPVGFETTLGMRYFFTKNIGAYVELGIAKALAQGGLTIKF
jgi:opacity protein-like surface antigen